MSEYRNPYDFITKLSLEKEVQPNWWKLKWKPIWRGTFGMYRSRYGWKRPTIRAYRTDWKNGWHRSLKQFRIEILYWEFWVFFDCIVHESGPGDSNKTMKLNKTTMMFEWEGNTDNE